MNFEKALTPKKYNELMQTRAEVPPSAQASDLEKERHTFTKLNLQRSSRILRTYQPSEPVLEALHGIEKPQIWLAISELWCGDSAQTLPYFERLAALNSNIAMHYVLRDENPAIMDQYLTDGKRAIPIVIALDADGNELFRWGSRPKEAAELFHTLKAQGLEKPQIQEKIHLWYGRNRGKALEGEIVQCIKDIRLLAA